jgi:MFS family permease
MPTFSENASSSHLRRLLAVLLVAPFMAQTDATIANVATPSIRSQLAASGAAIELIISGYLIAFAVLLIPGARLGRSYGYRRVYITGMALFSAASLGCGLASAPAGLIVARVLQGAGAALMFPQTLTGIQLHFSGRARARAIGLYAVALSSGAVVGQALGGALVSADLAGSRWRSIFLINVPLGLIAAFAAARVLPAEERRGRAGIDPAGVGVLSTAVLLVVLPLALGRSQGWPAWTWASLAASLPVFALFLRTERRAERRGGAPLLKLEVLARPTVSWTLATLLLATSTYYALLFTLAQYLQQGLGRTALLSGLTLLPWVAAFGVAGQLVARAPRRIAPLLPSIGCLVLAGAFTAVSASSFAGPDSEPLLLVLLGLGGLGLGIQFSAVIARLTSIVPPAYASEISGVSSTTAALGGALGVAAFGSLYFGLGHATGALATRAFALTTAALAAAALFAAAAGHVARGYAMRDRHA